MPRYLYFCEDCNKDFITFHGMNDIQQNCNLCKSTKIKKMLTKPIHFDKKKSASTGELTKKFIEENKKVLEDLKNEITQNE
tara:strand:- start:1054 stop:1296 length:243 start_codon:yes stop_codon:yes gene_type:complete